MMSPAMAMRPSIAAAGAETRPATMSVQVATSISTATSLALPGARRFVA